MPSFQLAECAAPVVPISDDVWWCGKGTLSPVSPGAFKMNTVKKGVASQSTALCFLMALACASSLLSCKRHGSDVEVDAVEGKEFIVTVSNRSEDALVVDDRLFSLSAESLVKVEVARAGGAVIAPCSYLDYVGTGSRLSLPPGEEVVLLVQLTALTATRCLTPEEEYLFRALLVSGDEVVSRTDWMPFKAASLE